MSTSKNQEVREGRLPAMIEFIAGRYGIDRAELITSLALEFPEMNERERCPNCDQSMMAYVYKVTYSAAMTLRAMAAHYRERIEAGRDRGTTPEVIDLVNEERYSDTQRHQTTILSYHGLLEKVQDEEGRYLGWRITRLGFEFLAGREIPMAVRVWRGRVEARAKNGISIFEVRSRTGESAGEDWRTEFYERELHQGRLI